MPSGAKKRKAAKKARSQLRTQQAVVSEQEVATIDSSIAGASSMNENPMEIQDHQTDASGSHMEAAPYPSMNEDIMDPIEFLQEQTGMGGNHMEATPSTSEGCMLKANFHLEGAEADREEKMMLTNTSVKENISSLEQSKRHQDAADEGTLATTALLRNIDTALELRSETVSALLLSVSSNEGSHEDFGQCVSCLHHDCHKILYFSTTSTTDTENTCEEQASESVDEEGCRSSCPCASNNCLSSLPAATTLHEEVCNVKQLVLHQSNSPNKDHTDKEKDARELSFASRQWGCCGVFYWFLRKS